MFDWLSEHYKTILITIWWLYVISLGVWILLQKRSSASTLSWLLALSFIPILGFFIYYFFGPKKITRQRLNRRRSRIMIERITGLWNTTLYDFPITEKYRSLTKLGYNSTNIPMSYSLDYELYSGGEATYEAMFKAIRESKDYILMEYYIFQNDITGKAMRDLLTQKAQEGVAIFLLVDTLGSWRLTRGFMRYFIEAGGHLNFFHDLTLKRLFSLVNFRNHRKLLVCDGNIAFTGGVNITDSQDLRQDPKAYHDVHIKLSGPAVTWLESIFLEDWHYSCSDTSVFKVIRENYRHKEIFKLHHPEAFSLADKDPYRVQILPSGPDTDYAPILRLMVAAMHRANHRIYLTTPYFVPDKSAMMALTSAALKGLDVRILVPQRSDNIMVTWAARSWYQELLNAGVKIYEYGPRMLHTKTLVIDDDLSFIGSANFDNRSFYINFELLVVCYERAANKLQHHEFMHSLESAKRIHKHQANFFMRLIEAIARLSAPLL